MSASSRWLGPACALALLMAGALHGCGSNDCLRDSDCDSALECRRGSCQVPLVKTGATGVGGEAPDASDASMPDADTSHPDGSAGKASAGTAGKSGSAGKDDAGSGGAAGESGGGGMSS